MTPYLSLQWLAKLTRWPDRISSAPGRFALVLTLGFVLGGGAVTQAIDWMPSTVPAFSGSKLIVDNTVTINGHPVKRGVAGAPSVIQMDGLRTTKRHTLPALNPPSFPMNGSTTDATEAHTPFVSATEVFYREITIAQGADVRFEGGGPFNIDELIVKEEGTVRLGAGTYFIRKLKLYGKRAQLLVTSEPVNLHIGKRFVAGDEDIRVNPNGTVTGLRLFLHNEAELKGGEGLQFTGLLYGPTSNRVKLRDGVTFRGPILTGGEVRLKDKVSLTYTARDQAAVEAMVQGTGFP